jgi:hypothetical protein
MRRAAPRPLVPTSLSLAVSLSLSLSFAPSLSRSIALSLSLVLSLSLALSLSRSLALPLSLAHSRSLALSLSLSRSLVLSLSLSLSRPLSLDLALSLSLYQRNTEFYTRHKVRREPEARILLDALEPLGRGGRRELGLVSKPQLISPTGVPRSSDTAPPPGPPQGPRHKPTVQRARVGRFLMSEVPLQIIRPKH